MGVLCGDVLQGADGGGVNNMVSCVFPGSFDPVTKGHLNLIERVSAAFDHVTVTVMVNISKKSCISTEKRVELLRKACFPFPNVSVESWDGLLADYLRSRNETIVVRGIRGTEELSGELNAFAASRMLNPGIETLFIPCDPSLSGISSSAVREIASFGGDISAFVPDALTEEITRLLSKKTE